MGHSRQPKYFGGMRICIKKFPLLFEGGVVGRIEYLIYTVFYFPTGVVGSLIYSHQYWYEKPKPLEQEKPK